MKALLHRLWHETDGQDLTEYALLLTLIALAAIAGMKVLATQINDIFSSAATNLCGHVNWFVVGKRVLFLICPELALPLVVLLLGVAIVRKVARRPRATIFEIPEDSHDSESPQVVYHGSLGRP